MKSVPVVEALKVNVGPETPFIVIEQSSQDTPVVAVELAVKHFAFAPTVKIFQPELELATNIFPVVVA